MEQEGYNIGIKADTSPLEKANKLMENFESRIKTIQSSFSTLKMPNGILNGIQSLDKATQAYMQRLESQARLYAQDGQSAKAYETSVHALHAKIQSYTNTVDKLTLQEKDQRNELENLGRIQGTTSKAYQEQKSKLDNTITSLNNYKIALRQTENQLKNMPDSSFHKTRLAVEQNVSAIKRLEAETKLYTIEGNKVKANAAAWQANKLRVEEYQRELKRTQAEEEKLRNELSKLDRSSEAYTRTKTKINEVKTKEIELNTEIKKTQEEMNNLHPSVFDRIKSKLGGTRDEAKNTNGVFKSMFGANLAANFVTNGLSRVKDGFTSLLDSAKEYAMNQQTMNATWLTLTGNADKGKQMVNQVNDMAAAAQNSTEMVDHLSQKFYAINKDASETGKLTKSVLTLQDAFGQTDDAVENFGVQFSQMMANGKVSAQDMMSFVNTFPVLRTNLLKTMKVQTNNHNLTMKQMNDLMSKGKISSKTMIQVVQDTAKEYQGATDNFNKTIPGMVRTVKSQMPRLMQAFEEPFTKLKNPFIKKISDWVSSKEASDAFSKLGKTMSSGVDKFLGNLTGTDKPKSSGKAPTKVLSPNIRKQLMGKDTLDKTLASLPKEEQARIKAMSTSLPKNSLDSLTNPLSKTPSVKLPGGISKNSDDNKPGSKVFDTNLAKQLSAYNGLTKAEDKYNAKGEKVKSLNEVISDSVNKLNDGLKKTTDFLANHAKDFKDIASDIFTIASTIGKTVFKDAANILTNVGKAFGLISKNSKGDAIHQLAQGLNNIAKNKTALKIVGDTIVAIATVKGLGSVGGTVFKIGSKAVGAAKNTSALIKGLRGIKNIKGLSETAEKFNNIGSGIRKAAGKLNGFNKTAATKLKDLTKTAGTAGKNAGKKLKDSFATSAGKIKDAVKGLGSKISSASKSLISDAKDLGSKAGKSLSNGFKKSVDFGKGLAGKGEGAGPLNGALQSMASANKANGAKGLAKFNPISGYKNLTTAGKVTTGLAGAAVLADAGGQVFQGVKDIHDADKRSKDFGGATGTVAGGAIGMAVGGPIGAAIGSQIGKQLGTAGGEAVNKFTKGWQSKKPPKNFWSLENMGYSAHNMWNGFTKGIDSAIKGVQSKWRSLNKFFYNLGKGMRKGITSTWNGITGFFSGIVKGIQKAWNGITSWFSKLGRNAAKGFKNVWRGISGFFGGIVKGIQKAWNGITSWFGKLGRGTAQAFKNVWHGITGFFGGVVKGVQGVWNGTTKFFSGIGQGMVKGIKDAWSGIVDFFQGIWDKIKDIVKPIGDAVNGIKSGALNAWNTVTGGGNKKKAHANGGSITQGHTALVGEEGPELAYKPYANQVRILGENGPAFERVHSGEQILNARDTRKVMRGGLGRGTILKGYANGTTKLSDNKSQAQSLPQAPKLNLKVGGISSARKSVNKDFKDITTNAKRETKKLNSNTDKDFKNITKGAKKQTHSLYRNSIADFKDTTNKVGKQTDKIRENSEKDYTNMRKGVEKQMDYMHDGVIDSAESTSKGFGKALDKMTGYAQDAMKDTIGQLNNGISSIDKVLSQFGGNSQVIKPVHFATGTDADGRLTQNTLAMVNDATTGPRQEALISDTNEIYYPQGDNITMMLPAGWGVLNGEQTQKVQSAQSAQQEIQHFAKGSGVDEDKLIKIAEAGQKDPAKDFKNSFLSNIKPKGAELKQGVISMAGNGSNQYGVPWNNAMWSVINDAIGGGADGKGGTREAFLKYAQKTFSGVPYAMGAMSKAATDCSGMVAQALQHFGINIGRSTVDMQTSKGVQSLGQDISKTQPGDIVVFGHGTGAAGHVGIISNPKTHMMFNANGGYGKALTSSIDESKSMGYEYFRVKGLHDATSSDTKKLKDDNRLKSLAKQQLGSKAIKWIEDNLGDAGELGGNIGGEGVERWRGTVKKILRMLDLSTSTSMVDRVLRQINTESSGNPHAKQAGSDPDGDGSGPAMGLMQTKRSTFDQWKRSPNSDIFNGPDSIYAGLNYAKHKYGPTLYYLGQGHGYAKGGKIASRTPFIAGEQGPELITADGPVKVDTHEETKRKLSDVSSIVNRSKTVINEDDVTKRTGIGSILKNAIGSLKSVPKPSKSINPTVNININGPISSTKDAQNVSNLVARKFAEEFEKLGDAFGYEIG